MRFIRLLIQLSVMLNVDVALAQSILSNTELFAKCYSKITDHPVELDSTVYKQVEAGSLAPVTACMQVLKKAMFTRNGTTRQLVNPKDEVTLATLRNFHQFHLSWFTSNVGGDGTSIIAGSFVDLNEPALYITDALFDSKNFKSIVTSNEPLRGLRSNSGDEVYQINGSQLSKITYIVGPYLTRDSNDGDNFAKIPFQNHVPVGALIGIQKAPAKVVPLPFGLAGGPEPLTDAQQAAHRIEGNTYDMTQHYGGGILGSPAGFLINDEARRPQDGGLRVHRRWANNYFYDLMCAKLPNLKADDAVVVAEFEKFKGSKLPFRQSKSCLACHVTLDNFAHAARNIEGTNLGNGTIRQAVAKLHPELNPTFPALIFASPVTKPVTPINDSDPYYHRRPPEGALIYRDFNNKLINEKVNGLQELGNKVATHDDIYMCAAKRYYSFLTGVDVSMAPVSQNNKFDYYHRQIVVGLSKRLKETGSLTGLIEGILNTQAFKARNPATVGDK